jgi:hypothetical protein
MPPLRIACDSFRSRESSPGGCGYTAGKGESYGHQEIVIIQEERRSQKGKSESRQGHGRVQARTAQVGRKEEGHQPEAGDRDRIERSARVRRKDPEEGGAAKKGGAKKKGAAKKSSPKKGVTKKKSASKKRS